jgi:plasmid maintenance system killer protein
MHPDFANHVLQELYYQPGFTAELAPEVVEDYRDCLQVIVASPNPRVLAALRDVERVSGDSSRHSISLKGHCRLIVKFEQAEELKTIIESIETPRGGHQ